MAPDRRFGLPHPLDVDPSEGSSRERKGLWDSLRKVFGGEAPRDPEPAATAAIDPLPVPLPAAARSDVPAAPVAPPPGVEPRISSAPEVTFLEELATPDLPPSPPIAPRREPPAEAPSSAATPGAARLARGLASFSKSNAEREKRFSHILRDGPTGKKKKKPGGSGS
jgi:hypothetical protein